MPTLIQGCVRSPTASLGLNEPLLAVWWDARSSKVCVGGITTAPPVRRGAEGDRRRRPPGSGGRASIWRHAVRENVTSPRWNPRYGHAPNLHALSGLHTWKTSVEDAREDRARRRGREPEGQGRSAGQAAPPSCDLFTPERLIHHVKVVAGGAVSDFKLGIPAPTSKVVSATEPRCFDS